ncbi:hypothetical protein [uncultured Kordia sp.]|uniref:hypothetical protein n=1 Tax=uncultured Kordia sp. TaxID=507699 RepID=UPI00261AF8E5|nr:hypothetical protein [uncultured Kordia sp.]
MKKITFLLVVFLTATFSVYSQDSKGVTNPDDVGKRALDILKKFENTSEIEFRNSMMTIEEVKEFVNKQEDSAMGRMKEDINKMDIAEYQKRVAKVYNDLKEKTKEFNIVWKDIEYVDFTYEVRNKRGLKGVEGEVFFKYKETEYKVKTDAVKNGDVYMPVIVRSLRKKDDD